MTETLPLVLVVDDGPANRLTLRLELVDHGFSVVEAGNGDEAIAQMQQHSFAAVVTDIWMPGADGIKLIQMLRERGAEMPIIVITGGGPGLSIASAAGLAEVWGAQKVFVKPFDVRELVRALKQLLA